MQLSAPRKAVHRRGGADGRRICRPAAGIIAAMTKRTRRRHCIVLLTLLCLLFQQAAMAAYACSLTQMPPDPAAMSADCDSMALQQVPESTALCAKHCAPDQSVAADHSVPSVPASTLPPPMLALAAVRSADSALLDAGGLVEYLQPPPRLRYCRFLI